MRTNCSYYTFISFLFVLISFSISGQINLENLEKVYGTGEVSLKKTIKISFFFNEKTQSYNANVLHRYEKLYSEAETNNGLTQIPFNNYQEVELENARFYKLDSAGEKILIENVKVKYADTKDFFIKNIFYTDLKVKQFKSEIPLPEKYLVNYSYKMIYKDLKFLSAFYFQHADESERSRNFHKKKYEC